jgi:hypothetical protein
MSMEITLTQEVQQTRVVIAGGPTVGQLCSLFQVLAIDSPRWAADRVLVDLSGADTSLTAADKARLQEEGGQHLRRPMRFIWPRAS